MDAQLGDLRLIEVERQLGADNDRDLGALAGAARRARCAPTRPLAERERREAHEAAPLSLHEREPLHAHRMVVDGDCGPGLEIVGACRDNVVDQGRKLTGA